MFWELAADEKRRSRSRKTDQGWTRAKKVILIQTKNPTWIDVTPDVLQLLRLQ